MSTNKWNERFGQPTWLTMMRSDKYPFLAAPVVPATPTTSASTGESRLTGQTRACSTPGNLRVKNPKVKQRSDKIPSGTFEHSPNLDEPDHDLAIERSVECE
jgi:hypothetical protein